MTDHNKSSSTTSWLWKKKSSEKNGEPPAIIKYQEEIHGLQTEKAKLEKDLKELNSKLSSVLAEYEAKDDLAKKHSKTAQEALAGWEKAEAKALSLRQELNETIEQKSACEENNIQLDTALKECMQQLRFVREDQEQRMHDALTKITTDFEESRLFLEEKLGESSGQITELTTEIGHLSDTIVFKDQLIEELNRKRAKADADFSVLKSKLESKEKEIGSLRYEVRIFEKEVNIRNEEKEFNRRTADATHKQHLDNVKKIAKLESECQRLRVLVKKRLPGPAALVKMKNEVQMLERDSPIDARRRRKSDQYQRTMDFSADDSSVERPGENITALNEKISALEEENSASKEIIQKKTDELQILRNMYARTSLKLSQIEAQLDNSSLCNGQITSMGLRRNSLTSHDIISEIGSIDDKASSCPGSWASPLITDLERRKSEEAAASCKSVAVTDMNLMDDFVEMEKLALVSVEDDSGVDNEGNLTPKTMNLEVAETNNNGIVPANNDDSEIKVSADNNGHLQAKLGTPVSRLIEIIEGINVRSQTCNDLGMSVTEDGNSVPFKNSEYMVRVFHWKASELSTVLQSFLHACDDLLNEKADSDVFMHELTSTLDWIVNHCFSLQDVSSMKEAIKKHFDLDESRKEAELDVGIAGHLSNPAADRLPCLKEELVPPAVANDDIGYPLSSHAVGDTQFQKADQGSLITQDGSRNVDSLKTEGDRQSPENDFQKAHFEEKVQSKNLIKEEIEMQKLGNEDLNKELREARNELNEARQKFPCLESELEDKRSRYEELEVRCLDLELQLESMTTMDTHTILSEEEKQVQPDWQISSASERLAQCQETILNLGKQFKALASPRDASLFDKVIVSTPTSTEAKLASSPTPTNQTMSQRSSLLDQMLAVDDIDTDSYHLESPKTKEVICASSPQTQPGPDGTNSASDMNGSVEPKPAIGYADTASHGMKHNVNGGNMAPLAIVPVKKHNGGLFRRLLWRKRKSNKKKMASLPFAA